MGGADYSFPPSDLLIDTEQFNTCLTSLTPRGTGVISIPILGKGTLSLVRWSHKSHHRHRVEQDLNIGFLFSFFLIYLFDWAGS